MIARPKVNFREYQGSRKLIEQKINPRKGVLVLDCDFIKGSIVHTHIRRVWSCFFTKMVGQHHGEELSLINPFSNRSCSCVFNSANSLGCMQYDLLEIGVVPGFNSMTNSISLSGGNPGKSSRNTSRNSHATRILCTSCTIASKALLVALTGAGT
jgi:hypothetical protein